MSARNGECPICNNISLRYFICSNGHTICKVCLQQIIPKKCPICRVEFHKPPTRNRMVEEIVLRENENELVPCQNQISGCNYHGEMKNVLIHLSSCVHKPFTCPRKFCDEELLTGDSLVGHFSNDHNNMEQLNAEKNPFDRASVFFTLSVFKSTQEQEIYNKIILNRFDGKHFYFKQQLDVATNEYCIWVCIVGSKKEAERYRFQNALCTPGVKPPEDHPYYHGYVLSCYSSEEEIQKKCLRIPFVTFDALKNTFDCVGVAWTMRRKKDIRWKGET